MKKITLINRLHYRFDNMMASGVRALIVWLFGAALMMILLIAAVVALTQADPEGRSFLELAWASLMRTLDPGTMGGDIGNWFFRLMMLTVTVGGIFVVGALIGIITNGIDDKLTELRKGRSIVAEKNHIVILGWSPKVFSIISELVIANENQANTCIAILADVDKVLMEDQIRERVRITGKTRVVCRRGSPIDLTDLEIINPRDARSIIVISPESKDPDSQVIKTILALSHIVENEPANFHSVAEIRNHQNLGIAAMVGRDRAHILHTDDLIARITAQTCRQSGLSVVYTELLDFGGDEIYFQAEPELVGRTFGAALLAYETSSLIGLATQQGEILLNPPMERPIQQGDQVIAISEDDDTVTLSELVDPQIDEQAIVTPQAIPKKPERTLILGWNRRAPRIVCELDQYVAPGSEVTVVAENAEWEASFNCQAQSLQNLKLTFRQGDTTDHDTIASLEAHTYNHVIILSYADLYEEQQADARTLVALLHIREIDRQYDDPFTIVSEMLDVRNRDLAEIAKPDDFIVSERLVSLMLSQVAENPRLEMVFKQLFSATGSEIYLKPAGQYLHLGHPTNFYTVVEAARRRGEVAIGYRQRANLDESALGYGVVINPQKSTPVSFAAGDSIIVLAEDA